MTIEKSKLRTDFICVATSGYSIDGRQITSQELHEMAETYDPQYYTANMWPDHKRWMNFGQVLSLKAEDQENGETKLYAILAPTDHLVSWNKDGQYLFTSIEIAPNFRNSGKAYLFGLGVTDTPASVGTTQLNFSLNHIPQNVQLSEFHKIDFALKTEQDEKMKSFFGMVKDFFTHQEVAINSSQYNKNKEENEMNTEQFTQLLSAFNVLGEKIEKHFSTQQPAPQEQPEQKPEQAEVKEDQVVTAEQFKQLIEVVSGLDKKFTALLQESTPAPSGVPGTVNGKIEVDGYSFNFGK